MEREKKKKEAEAMTVEKHTDKPEPQTPKHCKRCKRDKSEVRTFHPSRALCHSCYTSVVKYEKAGTPAPEYKPRGGNRKKSKTKNEVKVTIESPLGEIKDMRPVEAVIEEKMKKTELISRDNGRALQVKATLDPDYYLTVDFTAYPDIKNRLDELARKDFRSPEMEVLALLDKYFIGNEETP